MAAAAVWGMRRTSYTTPLGLSLSWAVVICGELTGVYRMLNSERSVVVYFVVSFGKPQNSGYLPPLDLLRAANESGEKSKLKHQCSLLKHESAGARFYAFTAVTRQIAHICFSHTYVENYTQEIRFHQTSHGARRCAPPSLAWLYYVLPFKILTILANCLLKSCVPPLCPPPPGLKFRGSHRASASSGAILRQLAQQHHCGRPAGSREPNGSRPGVGPYAEAEGWARKSPGPTRVCVSGRAGVLKQCNESMQCNTMVHPSIWPVCPKRFIGPYSGHSSKKTPPFYKPDIRTIDTKEWCSRLHGVLYEGTIRDGGEGPR